MKTASMLAVILCAGSLGAQTKLTEPTSCGAHEHLIPADDRPCNMSSETALECSTAHVPARCADDVPTSILQDSFMPVCGLYQHQSWRYGVEEYIEWYCADDMHQVTEKEWQELMVRLKTIEGVIYYPIQARPQTGMPMIIRGTSVLPVQGGSTESQPLQKQTLHPSQKPAPEPKKN